MFIGRPSCTLKRICHRLWCFKQLAQTIVFQATSKVLSTFMAANFGRGKVLQLVPKPFFLKHFAGVQGTPSYNKQSTIAKRSFTSPTRWGKKPHLHGRDILAMRRWTPKTGGKIQEPQPTSREHPSIGRILMKRKGSSDRSDKGLLYDSHPNKCLGFFGGKALKIAIQIAACLIPPVSWVPF